jgi:glutathione S-transferase
MSNKIKIYGGKKSRAIRCMWMMEELGLEYECQPLDFTQGENKTPEYLALNPAGKVPTLVDGDFVLFESMAITNYLAEKYSSPLMPTTVEAKALTNQWTLWSLTEVELFVTLAVREMKLGEKADQGKIKDAVSSALAMVNTLEQYLANGNDYLLGSEFSLADLNTASVLCFVPMIGANFDNHPRTAAWLGRCLSRPAWQKLQD